MGGNFSNVSRAHASKIVDFEINKQERKN